MSDLESFATVVQEAELATKFQYLEMVHPFQEERSVEEVLPPTQVYLEEIDLEEEAVQQTLDPL